MSLNSNARYFAGDGNGTSEHAQTLIMEQNASSHNLQAQGLYAQGLYGSFSSDSSPLMVKQRTSSTRSISSILEYGGPTPTQTIRFQVLVWSIGKVDMVAGRVPMTFRVTIFWNDQTLVDDEDSLEEGTAASVSTARSTNAWQMQGRQSAIQTENKETERLKTIDVPAVSILNVVTFDTIGAPEVTMLREADKLMRWTCMYRATLIQDHWRVDNFPHDEHDISLKLGILTHRRPGTQWDRNIWKLGLATGDDSQGATKIPHGLIVGQVSIPEFSYSKSDGLSFAFIPLDQALGTTNHKDVCLEVKLKVLRDSSYYDNNIVPLLAMLNLVAISITALEAQNFFERGLLTLNIAFVEIGMRMTADSKLPPASYQIKMQRILNQYFFGLLLLVLESLVVYELFHFGCNWTDWIDAVAALAVLSHNIWTVTTYYGDKNRARLKVLHKYKSK